MKIVGVTVICVLYVATAQTHNEDPIESRIEENKSRWEEISASHKAFIEASNLKRNKFSCVLNLLKNALAEELQNSNCTADKDQENVVTSFQNIIEEKQALEDSETQLEKPIITDDENCVQNELILYKNAQSEIISASLHPQNISNDQTRIEMPTMIPIFKPRPQPVRESNQISADAKTVVPTIATNMRQIPNQRAVSFVPEKSVETNLGSIPRKTVFEIPCQRAADVLDMNIGIPREAVCRNISPITNNINAITPKQSPSPVTVTCADDENTVAMLFKPKNITMQQVYGNLLKKITITVLVPYHMSKLGQK